MLQEGADVKFLSGKRMVLFKSWISSFGNCQPDPVQQKLKTTTGEHALSFKESALLEMLILKKNDELQRAEALLKIRGDDSYYNTRCMDVFMTLSGSC